MPSEPRFDWYGATVLADQTHLYDVLRVALADTEVRAAPGGRGYARGYEFRRGDRRVAVMRAGGGNEHPYAEASGADAPALARLLRAVGLAHRVARADVCVDVDRPGAFDALSAALRRAGKAGGLRLEL
ncbi:MAG: hypothetical protein LBD90_08635, partial [Bifidobacteriaceae bacterium]|nr:hypothetical protein [Bifidobacteriaceae bacterium]